MVMESLIVRCPNCGAKNRIPQSRAKDRAVCGKCRTPLPLAQGFPEHPVDVFDLSFANEVLGFSGPVFTLFWARWCGHCARLMPIIDELASDFSGKIKFAKMELEKNPVTASRYQIQSVPVMLLFKDGRMVNQLHGALPKYQIEYHLRGLIQ